VVLGEGRLDATSFDGKVVGAVLPRARSRGVRVSAVVGQSDGAPPAPGGPDAVFTGGLALDREAAFRDATRRLALWLTAA
jgi:glycerate kinase